MVQFSETLSVAQEFRGYRNVALAGGTYRFRGICQTNDVSPWAESGWATCKSCSAHRF